MVTAIAEENRSLEILIYERTQKGYFYKHKALVQVDNRNTEKETILRETAIQSKVHPELFGQYDGKVSRSSQEGQYIVVWESEMYS